MLNPLNDNSPPCVAGQWVLFTDYYLLMVLISFGQGVPFLTVRHLGASERRRMTTKPCHLLVPIRGRQHMSVVLGSCDHQRMLSDVVFSVHNGTNITGVMCS